MPISYVLVFIVLGFIAMGVLGARGGRRLKAGATELAAALGFDIKWGVDAVTWMKPEAERQAAREEREKLPAAVRLWADRSIARESKDYFCLVGTVDGVHVALYRERQPEHHNMVVRADYPKPLPFDLYMAAQGNAVEHALFGGRDLQIGDEPFDRAVRINTSDDARARALLDKPGARDAVLGLVALSNTASANNVCAKWTGNGNDDLDPVKTRERLEAVVRVAQTLGDN